MSSHRWDYSWSLSLLYSPVRLYLSSTRSWSSPWCIRRSTWLMTPWHGSMSASGSAAFPPSRSRTWRATAVPCATPSWICGQWPLSEPVDPSVPLCNELIWGVCVSRSHVDLKKLSRNTKLIAEALARVVYNLTEKVRKLFKDFLTVIHKLQQVSHWEVCLSWEMLKAGYFKKVTFSIQSCILHILIRSRTSSIK